VAGCPKPVDGNRWNGDEQSLLQWFDPATEMPAPMPTPAAVTIDIQTPEGVEISVSVNGKRVS